MRYLGFILSILLFFALSNIGSASETEPKIILDRDVYIHGNVEAGTSFSVEFLVSNKGDAPLLIKDVFLECYCLEITYDKEIPPNQTGKVMVKVNVFPEWMGQTLSKSIEIETNDRTSPTKKIVIYFNAV